MNSFDGCRCDDGWKAWLDTMPPNKKVLQVEGSCTCEDGGHHLRLVKAIPQGSNPTILILKIEDKVDTEVPHHVQRYPLNYREEEADYRQVTIMPCNLTIDVSIIS